MNGPEHVLICGFILSQTILNLNKLINVNINMTPISIIRSLNIYIYSYFFK
jgi:hypothetical protein